MWSLILSSLAVSAVAIPLSVVHEKRSGFSETSSISKRLVAQKDAIVPVRIGLVQRNLDRGYEHVLDVSDPSSENYGKHWTAEQVDAEFAPSAESIELIQDWLAQSGIENAEETRRKGWISFDVPVSQLEDLLNAEFYEFQNSRDGSVRLGCDEYSLPQHIAPYVDYITPGVKLSPAVKKVKRGIETLPKHMSPPHKPAHNGPVVPPPGATNLPPDLRTCGFNITPACVRALYDLPAPGSIKVAANVLGIYEQEDQYAQKDLNKFFAKYAPYVPQGTHPKFDLINGPQSYNFDGGESDIDLDMSYGILGSVNITVYQTDVPSGYNGPDDIFDAFLDAIDGAYCSAGERKDGFQCGGDALSQVVSFSYGTPELFLGTAASKERSCNEFMKLSLQGHTFVVSSGDYGVASNPQFGLPEFLCSTNGCIPQNLNNTGTHAYNGKIFSPQFPANCPFVLAVGGTQLVSSQTVNDHESAMNVLDLACGPGVTFSSGGGFSNYYNRPSYQDTAVCDYFNNHNPPYKYYESNRVDVSDNKTNIGQGGGIYNRIGRAYPDVSANGANFTIYNDGEYQNFYGTSLAAPIWASIISLLNAQRAEMGKAPVGFINPTLYKNPQAFHDIVSGNNAGCGTNGFTAVPGWDPVTGLGTPNFPALSAIFKSLP